jgi:DEAD/DEAH box helicase domain-containing protein
MRNVTHWKHEPAREARFGAFPQNMSPALQKALEARGIRQLFTHQAQAVEQILAGENVIIVTPTASGKTLCYNIPIINKILDEPEARALYLFPTKALSQDQMHEIHELVTQMGVDLKVYTFDGDTPQSARKAIRSAGHIVVTNPDMLHQGILPHHTLWIKLFENLKYIVVDEIHHYRGVFGSHLANVVRRLQRICTFYGSNPQFICSSATIANPQELAEKITGKPIKVIDDNGAPHGEKHFIFYNPPVVNAELGIRASSVRESQKIAQHFLAEGIQTIVFARSRTRVELLSKYLQEKVRGNLKLKNRVKGYRGGYLPNERRAIEKGLRSGEILGVISTNALELGIDIGELHACVMSGYPGTIASTWQQAGRAGRKTETSIAVLVATSGPLDQYIINHPEFFTDKSPEAAIVDPDNLLIMVSHIKCAAFELPFADGEKFGYGESAVDTTRDILEYLQEKNILHHADGKWHWMAETYPAEAVSLRSASTENVVIIDRTADERVIGEIDYITAPLYVHQDAIYMHGTETYHVDRFDWQRKKAYVRRVDSDYYTDAQVKSTLKVLDIFKQENIQGGGKAHGEVSVTTVPTMFKKIKFRTHENVGWAPIELPELELQTAAYWWEFDPDTREKLKLNHDELGDGLKAVANVLGHVAPIFIMADPADIISLPMVRSPFTDLPTIYIYERYPGGVGFSQKLFQVHEQIVSEAIKVIEDCGCESGCPSCVGPELEVGEKGKVSAIGLLDTKNSLKQHKYPALSPPKQY